MSVPNVNNSNKNKKNNGHVDLDLFLTAVESKLRGPFSSLDLTKTLTTPALRGDISEVQYLKQVKQVLSKSDKIIQMRILISLLGLEHESEMDQVIFSILQQVQRKLTPEEEENLTEQEKVSLCYEEWPRIIAGLIQGIMFKDEETGNQYFGEDAKQVLESTCHEIVQEISDLAQSSTEKEEEEDDPLTSLTSLITADFDPIMAPYRYSLLNHNLLQNSIPDALGPNPHFQVNFAANVLNEDAKLELSKAKEETEHVMMKQGIASSQRLAANNASGSNPLGTVVAAAAPRAYLPGAMRQTTKTPATAGAAAAKKNASQRPKTNMFITNKRPAAVATGAAGRGAAGLHVRKTGAAQALVGKGRTLLQATGGAGAGSAATATALGQGGGGATRFGGGRALKQAGANGARSRMKMIDASEATDLAKQQDQPHPDSKSKFGVSLKRKAAGATRLGSNKAVRTPQKVTAPESRTTAPASPQASEESPEHDAAPGHTEPYEESHDTALAAAALAMYQTQTQTANSSRQPLQQQQPTHPPVADNPNSALAAAALSRYQTQLAAAPVPPTAAPKLNWQQLLSIKSNKLTDDDRLRVQQFFEHHINPTPDQPVYKMKLHEERTTDPVSGKPVKETYYLELNYTNFTSKQSKKVKRYD